MRLFIAEKPSVARVIAQELGITSRQDGYIECKNNNTVTWCFGHLLEQAEPDYYIALKDPNAPKNDKGAIKWRWQDLPIIPTSWHKEVKSDAKKQFKIIKSLLAKANEVVNAGDPDREGQLLVDEVLEFNHFKGKTLRYWCNAQDQSSVKKALGNLKDNNEYEGMKLSAEARSKADWLVGMNITRAYTLASHHLVTVGRVQSPTLKLVVDRDRAIENFKPQDYYSLSILLNSAKGSFNANLINDEKTMKLDDENRILDKSEIERIQSLVNNQNGVVLSFKKEKKSVKPPKGLSLADVQSKACKLYGYGAEQTLKLCQSLYEKKLTTYPRVDCCYLPNAQKADIKATLKAISNTCSELTEIVEKANPNLTSAIWNDEKTTAHHAIVPTTASGNFNDLSKDEQNIYRLVASNYIAQFYEPYEYLYTEIISQIKDFNFKSIGKKPLKQGWKKVYNVDDDLKSDDDEDQLLPDLNENDQVHCDKSDIKALVTKPPQRFTEGTLIKAMENIYKYIDNEDQRKILKDGDGIGTSATRANIISDLKSREYLKVTKKNIVSTELGRSIVDQIPNKYKSPVLTAVFERFLSQIESKEMKSDTFIQKQIDDLTSEIDKVRSTEIKLNGVKSKNSNDPYANKYKCKKCGAYLRRLASKNKQGVYFWSCSNYPNCKELLYDDKGKPQYSKGENKGK